jgi:hypothetical protein
MKQIASCLAACLVGIFTLQLFAAGDSPELVRVQRGGNCSATMGQTVHFVFRYDGFAGEVITGLEVMIDGKPLIEPKIEIRADPKMADVGEVIFVFRPSAAGAYRVEASPLVGAAKKKAREHILKVAEKK